MHIYIYAENCISAGNLYRGTEEEAAATDDAFLWGEGTEAELIEQALADLAKNHGNGPATVFAWKCAKNVLRSLGGPEVEYDKTTGVCRPVVAETEE